MKKEVITFLATGGFAGNIPLLGGTLGSIEGILISVIFNFHLLFKGIIFGMLFISGIYLASIFEKMSGVKDDRRVVIDEAAGGVLATFFLPQGLLWWTLSLVFFRLFDWLKPFPMRRIERLRGGIGIMGDDVVAALYSLGVSWGIYLVVSK